MGKAARVTSRATESVRARENAIALIRLLASKTDSLARIEIYRQDAARRGSRDYERTFNDLEESDRKHLEWLKKEILRNIKSN